MVQGHANGGLRIESQSRIRVGPKNRTRVWSSELVLHKVVTNPWKISVAYLLNHIQVKTH